MKLYFTCPKAKADFASDDYSLQAGHRIVEDEHGDKKLMGIVSLNSGCPLCGQKHRYEVKDVMCPISGEKNEE
jgi:hypothetical protein